MTPEQIAEIEFRTVMRGYDPAEVDEVLDDLADELARLRLELTTARAHAAAVPVGDAAPAAGPDVLAEARAEAERVLAAAHDEAERIRAEAARAPARDDAALRERRAQLEAHVERLRAFEASYHERLRQHLVDELAWLDRQVSSGATVAPSAQRLVPDGDDDV